MLDEGLSKFLDDECTPTEARAIISDLGRDPGLRASWQRGLWMRAVLRYEGPPVALDLDFADRVMAALEEPVPGSAKVVALRGRRRWRSATRWAAAASVAAAVVLVSNPAGNYRAPATDTIAMPVAARPSQATAVAQTAPPQPQVIQPFATPTEQPVDHWSVSDPAIATQLNAYLIEHSGVARNYGLSGATPSFVHLATYGQGAGQ